MLFNVFLSTASLICLLHLFFRIKTPAQKLQDGTLSNEERVALLKNASNNLMKGKGSKETFNFPEPDSLNPLSIWWRRILELRFKFKCLI